MSRTSNPILLYLLLVVPLQPVKSQHSDSASLAFYGLQNQTITTLAAEGQDPPISIFQDPLLFAGTDGDGVFQITVNDSDAQWRPFGLEERAITALTVKRWGIGPIESLLVFAGVAPTPSDSTRVFARDAFHPPDTVWTASDSGLSDTLLTEVKAINGFYFRGHTAPQPDVLGGNRGLYRRDYSQDWTEAAFPTPVKTNAMDVTPHYFGDLVWAAGQTGLSPAAFRSTDKGVSWETFVLPSAIEGEALSVAINPRHPDSVYVGQTSGLFVTPDSGQTWSFLDLQTPGVQIHALGTDPVKPENVFAGGATVDGEFAFFHSENGGVSWNRITPSPAHNIADITSLVVLYRSESESAPDVFIATNGTGVWRYKSDVVTTVDEPPTPQQFTLFQNAPNPFNPSTTISYALAQPGRVTLSVYNILGQKIQTLVEGWQSAGEHTVVWDGTANGRSAASGVYIYELHHGNQVERKKMLLLR